MTASIPAQSKSSGWLVPGLVILIGLLMAGNLAQLDLPLVRNDRLVLITVLILGQVLCTLGMRIGTFSWTHPSSIIGVALGVLLYGVVLLHLFGVSVPFLPDDQAVLVFLAAVMLVKMLVDFARMRMNRR